MQPRRTFEKLSRQQLEIYARELWEHFENERQLRRQLEDENRMRSQFINVLAHELRGPLTISLACATMLAERLSPRSGSLEERLINNMIHGVRTLEARVNDLLDIAKLQMGTFVLELQNLNPVDSLKEVASLFKPVAESKRQQLILDLPKHLPQIEADRGRLEQVILNLLHNASKFSLDSKSIALRARTEKGELVVEIQDWGIGISPEEQERLFQPYYRVEQDRQRFPGMGLGLALSKQILDAHGGRLWVESEVGKGSIFRFSLPLSSRNSQLNQR